MKDAGIHFCPKMKHDSPVIGGVFMSIGRKDLGVMICFLAEALDRLARAEKEARIARLAIECLQNSIKDEPGSEQQKAAFTSLFFGTEFTE